MKRVILMAAAASLLYAGWQGASWWADQNRPPPKPKYDFFSHSTIEPMAGKFSVIDGDTLEINRTRVRLYGIDAPESDQLCERDGKQYRCGQAAALALADFIGSSVVGCKEKGRDRYMRTIAQCEAKGVDLGRWMVQSGHALAYRQYSVVYIADEDQAKATRMGMWAGQFQPPWEYRASKRQ